MSAAALANALSAARSALERGDGAGAARAVEDGVRACAAMTERGERLAPAAAAELAGAAGACLARAIAERDRLAAELDGAARSRRAAHAYGAAGAPDADGPS